MSLGEILKYDHSDQSYEEVHSLKRCSSVMLCKAPQTFEFLHKMLRLVSIEKKPVVHFTAAMLIVRGKVIVTFVEADENLIQMKLLRGEPARVHFISNEMRKLYLVWNFGVLEKGKGKNPRLSFIIPQHTTKTLTYTKIKFIFTVKDNEGVSFSLYGLFMGVIRFHF